MQYRELTNLLDSWARYIIAEAKNNLIENGKGDGALYSNMTYNNIETDYGFNLQVFMEDYAKFVDQGVKGADPNIITEWTKNRGKEGSKSVRKNPIKGKQKAPRSPFSYKTSYPPAATISSWAKKKNFRLRDDKGRFVRGGYKSIGYVLSKFIFAQGIAPSLFLTNALNSSMKLYAEGVAENLAIDLMNNLKIDEQN
jgi:hypothetical protein